MPSCSRKCQSLFTHSTIVKQCRTKPLQLANNSWTSTNKTETSYGSGLDAGPRKAPGHMECCPARTSGTFGLWKEQMDLPQPNSRTNGDLREIYVFIIWGKAFLSLQTSFSKQYFGFDFKTVFLSWEDYTNRVGFFHQRILILIKEKKREVLRVVIQLLNKGCGIKDSDIYHFFLTWCFPFLFS